MISGGQDPSGWRLPASGFEAAVASVIVAHLKDCAHRHRITNVDVLVASQDAAKAATNLAQRIEKTGATIASSLISSGSIARGHIRIMFQRTALADHLGISSEALLEDLINIDSAFT